jgi:Mg/Co/Ni transporter MgtE
MTVATSVLIAVARGQPTTFDAPFACAVTVELSILNVLVGPVAIGSTKPIVLDRIGTDPELASGVFITHRHDILIPPPSSST